MRKIEFTTSAINDLEDIKIYYTEQQVPQIGDKFISEIISHVETLIDQSEIGRIVPEFQVTHIRELIHGAFRIVYQINDSVIYVIRIWRSERLMKLT